MQGKEIFTLKSTTSQYSLEHHEIIIPRFEMRIIKLTFIRIGIMHKKPETNLPVGSTHQSYSYSSRGYKFHDRVGELYGEPFGAGDIVGVEVGLDVGYIRFYKNGVDQGVAYWNVPVEDLHVGYSMYGSGEIVLNHSVFQVYMENENDMLMRLWE